jgi:hypothetical protein
MSQQSSEPAGPGSDDWPDDLWPDDDDDGAAGDPWPAATPPGWPGNGPGGAPGGGPPKRWLRPASLVAVALVAIVAGAAIALGEQVFASSPAPSASGSQPSSLGPAQPGGNGQPAGGGQVGPGGQAGPGGGFPGGQGQAFVIGKVLKVSATSLTIGGPGRSITAGITSATRVSGKVSAIAGIKVGDQVSAQITESGGKATLAAIQDPAQLPGGGVPGG